MWKPEKNQSHTNRKKKLKNLTSLACYLVEGCVVIKYYQKSKFNPYSFLSLRSVTPSDHLITCMGSTCCQHLCLSLPHLCTLRPWNCHSFTTDVFEKEVQHGCSDPVAEDLCLSHTILNFITIIGHL